MTGQSTMQLNDGQGQGMYHAVGYAAVDFEEFHQKELPRRLREGVSDRIIWDVKDAAPIAITLPGGRAFSYLVKNGQVCVEPGVVDTAETVVDINSEEAWIDYLYEMRTRIGLLYSQAVEFSRGNFESWDAWDPAIRCMYSGREIYNPATLDFKDLAGQPLDLHKRFALDDDPEEMSHFLRQTGYLVVKKVYPPELIAKLSEALDKVRDNAVEGELTSWWAEDNNGKKYPYRLTYLNEKAPVFADLYDHQAVKFLRELSREDIAPTPDRIEGILAVVKEYSPGAELTGFADLPFHNDCGMGGCHITCPSVLVSVQLDAANDASSQLHMMAGTWGKAFHPFPNEEQQQKIPIIPLVTEPGDATVHFGCGLHQGPSPTGEARRRTLYIQHYNPAAMALVGHHSGYNEIIPGYGEGAIANIDEVQAL
jgi:hypothetical protein